MTKAIADKLAAYIADGEKVDTAAALERWSNRVSSFMDATLGNVESSRFHKLNSGGLFNETLALRLGHLEGLVMTAEAAAPTEVHVRSESKTAPTPQIDTVTANGRRVFIVHGHDNEAKEKTARFIEKIGLEPIVLHEQPSGGRTIIEKFEVYSQDVAFAIVLLTPDDVGAAVAQSATLAKRARQNVIMELGYFIGKLGRTRVCALYKGDVELPSDYQGVIYIEMDSGGAWKAKIAQELVQSKISIELSGLLGA